MQTLSHKWGKVGSKNKPRESHSPPIENTLMQTFYDQKDKSKKEKKEKDNLRDFYKPL